MIALSGAHVPPFGRAPRVGGLHPRNCGIEPTPPGFRPTSVCLCVTIAHRGGLYPGYGTPPVWLGLWVKRRPREACLGPRRITLPDVVRKLTAFCGLAV